GLLLWNRLIWASVGCGVFGIVLWRFRFAPRERPMRAEPQVQPPALASIQERSESRPLRRAQFLAICRLELRAITKPVPIVVLLACCLALVVLIALQKATEGYGNTSFPVTYKLIELIGSGTAFFGLCVALFFAGSVVW